jgi:hypothetical protein
MNSDHRDNIGTHPAYSKDPETALRARLEAAQRNLTRAQDAYTTARNNLRVFLDARDHIAAAMPDEYPAGYAAHLAADEVSA